MGFPKCCHVNWVIRSGAHFNVSSETAATSGILGVTLTHVSTAIKVDRTKAEYVRNLEMYLQMGLPPSLPFMKKKATGLKYI